MAAQQIEKIKPSEKRRKQLQALEKSILKWKSIVDGSGVDKGMLNCTLCFAYANGGCAGCPIYEKTGRIECNGTPYISWSHYCDVTPASYDAVLKGGRFLTQSQGSWLQQSLSF